MKTTFYHKVHCILSLVILSVLSLSLNAQSITPTVIGAGGSNQANSFTIGESFVSTIGTDVIITQGFHQEYVISTSLNDDLDLLEVLIYPNPFHNEIRIKSNGLSSGLSLRIHDQGGRLVHEYELHNQKESVDLSHLLSGMYFATIHEEGRRVYSSKIIKK